MTDRFLLYIDILGFTEMVRKEPRKVARIYSILDSLNVHKHNSFRTIVFSDTVLVYNIEEAESDKQREYFVWYLSEFAEDLHHRLTGQDIYFRAMLVAGDFSHHQLENVDCFYGQALISAYLAEKEIPSLGLFIDNECATHNRYFQLQRFNSEYSFVYLSRDLENLHKRTGDKYPANLAPYVADIAPYLTWQVKFLQDIYQLMRSHHLPQVRTKFLTAWDLYKQRYPEMLKILEDNSFSPYSLGQAMDWGQLAQDMESKIAYFKRIGSGTALSMSITGSSKKSAKAAPQTPARVSASRVLTKAKSHRKPTIIGGRTVGTGKPKKPDLGKP